MIRSMTGFGEAEQATESGHLRVELRSVNHRHFNANVRLPNALGSLELEVREWLRRWFSRGHVNCTVRLEEEEGGRRPELRLDEERVQLYLSLFHQLRERFGIEGIPDLALLARYGDIFTREEDEGESKLPIEALHAVLDAAARQTIKMREDEGRRLQTDLEERLSGIDSALDHIAELAPERLQTERDRLREAVRTLVEGREVDEDRLAQEIAYLAERWDVNEELVRFRSHVELFRELLEAEAREPVGKRLSFLVQEMNREANTIGSKANDARISHFVVAIKDEVERLREQVENVE